MDWLLQRACVPETLQVDTSQTRLRWCNSPQLASSWREGTRVKWSSATNQVRRIWQRICMCVPFASLLLVSLAYAAESQALLSNGLCFAILKPAPSERKKLALAAALLQALRAELLGVVGPDPNDSDLRCGQRRRRQQRQQSFPMKRCATVGCVAAVTHVPQQVTMSGNSFGSSIRMYPGARLVGLSFVGLDFWTRMKVKHGARQGQKS